MKIVKHELIEMKFKDYYLELNAFNGEVIIRKPRDYSPIVENDEYYIVRVSDSEMKEALKNLFEKVKAEDCAKVRLE